MRRGFALAALGVMAATGVAAAQPADRPDEEVVPARPVQLGYGAMPGGLHVASAVSAPKGTVAVSAIGGFGRRTGLLGDDHKLDRGVGSLAVAFSPLDILTIGLALDGHADKHFGIGQDSGYVGDPRLIARVAKRSGKVAFGGELMLWLPGKDAPSVAGSATSVDARALVAVDAGPGSLAINAGFRLDNSIKSVKDLSLLSLQDKVSLGVSDYNAVVLGAAYTAPVGAKAFVTAEASTDIYLGSGHPGPTIRGGVSGGLNLNDSWSALAFFEVAKVPSIDDAEIMMNTIKIIPYEPAFTLGLGLQARFGGPKVGSSGQITDNTNPQDIEVVETATITGLVLDDAGKPVVGATVTVKTANHTGTDVTDETGAYTIDKLPIGKTVKGVTTLDDAAAELSIAVDGKKPFSQTFTLVKGPNQQATATLDPLLPPGQLMAVVRAAGSGKPVVGATITVTPGNVTATTGPDGNAQIDLPPGPYKAKVTAPGYKDQTLDVQIDTNGVAVKNFELPK